MVKSIKIAEVILNMDFAWNTQKNNMTDIKGLEKEQEREGKISNEEINLDKTHLNYDLVQGSLNLYQRSQNLPKNPNHTKHKTHIQAFSQKYHKTFLLPYSCNSFPKPHKTFRKHKNKFRIFTYLLKPRR